MSALMNQENSFSLSPKTMEEAERFAQMFCKSSLCPKHLQGNPGSVIMTIQMGYELNLKPLQAIKSIGVVNGIPFLWGDGKMAIVRRSPYFESIKEWMEGDIEKGTAIAYCTLKRKGEEAITRSFSVSDAKRAGLWDKGGVWKQYPQRMLQHRPRGFAINDLFSDVTMGLPSENEAYDMSSELLEKNITPPSEKGMDGLRQVLNIKLADDPIKIKPIENSIEEQNAIIDTSTGEILENYENEFIPPDLATREQVEDLRSLILTHGIGESLTQKWIDKAKVICFEEMNKEDIQACIDWVIKESIRGK